MKTSGKYKNGQIVSEQKGDILTFYQKNGKIKAQGKWIGYKSDGSIKKEENSQNGKLVTRILEKD